MKMKLKIENESYEVELGDLDSSPVLATVNGETFEVFLEEKEIATPVIPTQASPKTVAAPVRVAAKVVKPAATITSKSVVAPIPGVIDSIKVREGDTVKIGQELLVLEAMKMKNIIRATREGNIARIYVSVGDQVPHSHVLLDFAD
ncbi:MAG: biotin/lipoyl-binding protein [Anaerolineaceae bacterium]|nr:biotin/lipoyl-binding protein [Anaerolineaceae bacterium]